MGTTDSKLIIANCSGFFGDRFTAAREMVEEGAIDILTGDYLAELTMAILFQKKLKDPNGGYVPTFVKQMEQVMGTCLEKGIRVVANAGGLNPAGLAAALKELAEKLGLSPTIAWIDGDDLMPRMADLQGQGEAFAHLDRGTGLKESGAQPISANAYLGGWGIAAALEAGADIVVGGRFADAALVSGPCAWKFGWQREDWDQLAGAYVAGHIIECGAQATGGNYSFFEEVPSFDKVGFPIAEMHPDGSFVITKHPGTGGLVSTGTVTAQLLYEVGPPGYLTPDVTARFDTIDIADEGDDRVRIRGVRGEPPTDTAKVCINTLGGYKNSMTVILTGLDIEKKAAIVEKTLFGSIGGREQFDKAVVQLVRSDKEDPDSNEEAFGYLRFTVFDKNPKKVGRAFSSGIVEMALASVPGFTLTAPPARETPTVVHWPTLVSKAHLAQQVHLGEEVVSVREVVPEGEGTAIPAPDAPDAAVPQGETVRAPLGRLFATRAGDKGGNANLGVWGKSDAAYAFLADYLTVAKLKELLPDLADCDIERYTLPNLKAVNFVIQGILGEGAAASVRMDPQAKTLGEYLRARVAEIPASLLEA